MGLTIWDLLYYSHRWMVRQIGPHAGYEPEEVADQVNSEQYLAYSATILPTIGQYR